MESIRFARALAAAALCGLSAAPSFTAQGIEPGSVTFVQAADIERLAQRADAGAQRRHAGLFRQVNSQGGIHGRQLLLRTVDDGYVIKRTQEVTREEIGKDTVFAFVSSIGTANAEAVLPLINAAKVPLVAPLSGAVPLREPFSRYVFHVRSSYAQEVEKMVEHVLTVGIERVAVFYDDDAFGQDVARGVEEALARRKLKAVASGKVERGSTDVTQAVKAIAAARPQVVICGSFGKSLVEFIKAMKQTTAQPQF